jgi:hypothetical protein
MLDETIEYGTWKDGSSVYKDKIGYYIVDINEKGENYKKYLKNWKPVGNNLLYLDKTKGKWSTTKPNANKSKKISKKTTKHTTKHTTKKNTTKYANRPSPPYPANDYCGKNKRGNDKNMYTSKENKNGVCRWVKIT